MKLIILFAGIVFFISCKSEFHEQDETKFILHDSVRTYINTDTSSWLGYITRISRAANLDKLDSNYKDFQLRIWLGHSMAMKRHIVILKKKDDQWYGEILVYTVLQYDRRRRTEIKILEYRRLNPKSGWSQFDKALEAFKIIPFVKSRIEMGEGGSDGIYYEFELAEKGRYFLNTYGNPEFDTANKKEATAILDFAKMLELEFGFNYTK